MRVHSNGAVEMDLAGWWATLEGRKELDDTFRSVRALERAVKKRPHCLRCGAGPEWIENS